MAVGCMFYVLLLVTQLLEFTREYAANKDVRRENHHKYTGYYKIKDLLCDIDCDGSGFKWIFSMDKDFRHHLGQRAGKIFTLTHKDNTYIAFCTSLLMIAGDISSNPGPVQYPCAVCSRPVAKNHRALLCDGCGKWWHIGPRCGKIKPNEYEILKELDSFDWTCPACQRRSDTVLDEHAQNLDTITESDKGNIYGELKDSLNMKGLKVAHINVNGLFYKLHEIKLLLQETRLDVLAITETHLHKHIENDQLEIEGYGIARKDRQNSENNWGGCLIYFAEDLNAFEREDLNKQFTVEAVWIEIIIASQRLLIRAIYRQPDDLTFFGKFQNDLDQVWEKRNNILLLEDFNSDLNFRNQNDETYFGRKLLRVLNSFNMTNIIKKSTRVTETTKTTIDMIITTDKSKVKQSGSFSSGILNHHIVYVVLNIFRKPTKPKIIEVKNYKKLNLNDLESEFERAPWDICNTFDDMDDITWAWEHLYKDILNDHLTVRKVKIRTNSLPWMNSTLRKEMNLRYKLLKRAQNYPKENNIWLKYRKQRNYVTYLSRKTKAEYWNEKFVNASSSKDFWKTVKQMKGVNKVKKIGPIKAN